MLEAAGARPIEKTAFSAAEVPAVVARLEAESPTAVVVVGMEAHVCVYQTVRDLRNEVTRLCAALEALPPTQLVTETLIEAKSALGRIRRL